MIVRLVSINIWDLPVPLPRLDRKRRRARLLEYLWTTEADLILIQEAFLPRFRRRLIAALPHHQVDGLALATRRASLLKMDAAGGLLSFSRWPITRTAFQPSRKFRGMKPDERIGRKGCLWTTIETPAGPLLVGNVHLYAGNQPVDARVRAGQCLALVLAPALCTGGRVLLAGDFNMALEREKPDRRRTGFEVLLAEGFREVANGTSDGIMTMSPGTNRYARYAQRLRTSRRLTHVFLRGAGLAPGPDAPALCFTDPPVSDHYGLAASVTLASGGARA